MRDQIVSLERLPFRDARARQPAEIAKRAPGASGALAVRLPCGRLRFKPQTTATTEMMGTKARMAARIRGFTPEADGGKLLP